MTREIIEDIVYSTIIEEFNINEEEIDEFIDLFDENEYHSLTENQIILETESYFDELYSKNYI